VALAVNTAAVATPLALVIAVLAPPANIPLAPLAGGVNVTTTPLTALPPLSFTVAAKGAANGVLMAALWGVPLVAEMLAAGPGLLVRGKFTDVATPGTLAVTV